MKMRLNFKRLGHPGYGHQSVLEKCMKYILFFLNILFILGGCTVIGVGIWTLADRLSLESLLGTNLYVSAAWILIGTGCAVILISIFGCMGALRGIRCMLFTYFVILFMVFVVLLLGGILGYVFRDKVEESMRQQMHDTMIRDYGMQDMAVVTDAWDALQSTLECCGVDHQYNLTHWRYSKWHESQTGDRPLVPDSCCRVQNEACRKLTGLPLSNYVHLEPCLDRAKAEVKNHAVIVAIAGISTSCSLILGMVFSICLFREIEP